MIDVTGMPQTAVVIGGSSDIAGETLRRLAGRRLQRVLLVGRDARSLEKAAEELLELGVRVARTLSADVTDASCAAHVVEAAQQVLGEIDLLVLAAGDLGTGELDALDAASVSRLLAVNFTGQAAIGFAVGELMRRQGTGRIVAVSSVAGVRVRRSNFVYGAAKAGFDGFFQGFADALQGSGVLVTVVRPGFVRTKMTTGLRTPPFAVDAGAVAASIVRSLEKGESTVWVPAVLHLVFSGFRLLPRHVWRRLRF